MECLEHFWRNWTGNPLIKGKWRLISLLSEGIDGFKNGRVLDQFLLQSMLAWKIDKKNSQ